MQELATFNGAFGLQPAGGAMQRGFLRPSLFYDGDDGFFFEAAAVTDMLDYAPSSRRQTVQNTVPAKHKKLLKDVLTEEERRGQSSTRLSALWLSEAGLYCLLLRSTQPAALLFQEWVAGTLLKSARRQLGEQQRGQLQATIQLLMGQVQALTLENAALKEQARHPPPSPGEPREPCARTPVLLSL